MPTCPSLRMAMCPLLGGSEQLEVGWPNHSSKVTIWLELVAEGDGLDPLEQVAQVLGAPGGVRDRGAGVQAGAAGARDPEHPLAQHVRRHVLQRRLGGVALGRAAD